MTRKLAIALGVAAALVGSAALAQSVSVPAKAPTDSINVKVLNKGTELKTPSEKSKVTVHYEGTLLDGSVFDSSYRRGMPATFGLDQVIPCWTIGLQSVTLGSTVELTCPASTAYGARELPGIPANSVLKFKIELLAIQ